MAPPRSVVVLAGSLGMPDGLSSDAATWAGALETLGARVRTVSGAGRADVLLAGLSADSPQQFSKRALEGALADADVVVVHASRDLAVHVQRFLHEEFQRRRVLWRHHELAWQPTGGGMPPPARGVRWSHVTNNERSRLELAARKIPATTIYRLFPAPAEGDRERARLVMGAAPNEAVVLQPTRYAPHKNVAGGIRLAGALQGAYLLLGETGEEQKEVLGRLAAAAGTRLLDGKVTLEDAYAAADVVTLPSTWEVFGNAAVEAALRRRPFAVGSYPVSLELRRYGFRWFDAADPAPLSRYLARGDDAVTRRNQEVAGTRFDASELPGLLERLL